MSHGRAKYLGYVFQFGDWSIYHSGGTVRYDGMAEKLREFRIDVALLPINGRAAERRIPGNLFGNEAAELAKDLGAKLVIPCQVLGCGEKWHSRTPARATVFETQNDRYLLESG